MAEDNIAAARRVIEEGFGQGNLDVIDEVFAEDFVDHDPIVGEGNRETVKQNITTYRGAFPDLEMTIEDIFACDDKVVTRWTAQGTFQNEIMGQQPTGERGEPVEGIGIDRFEDGKIAEAWGQWNTLRFLQNIGAVPDAEGVGAGS